MKGMGDTFTAHERAAYRPTPCPKNPRHRVVPTWRDASDTDNPEPLWTLTLLRCLDCR